MRKFVSPSPALSSIDKLLWTYCRVLLCAVQCFREKNRPIKNWKKVRRAMHDYFWLYAAPLWVSFFSLEDWTEINNGRVHSEMWDACWCELCLGQQSLMCVRDWVLICNTMWGDWRRVKRNGRINSFHHLTKAGIMSGGRQESDSRGDCCNGYEMIRLSAILQREK